MNRNIPQSPSRRDIASCLLPLKSILHKDKTLIHEPLPAHLRASADEFYKKYFLEEFEVQTEQLLRETKFDDKRVAIFGFGPMPCLIALGSKLGNKGKFIPMLSVHDKFHRALVLSGFFFLKIASTFLNSSFFPKPIKRRIAI